MTHSICAVPRCPAPATSRGRCARHALTTSQRGYGRAHQSVRAQLRTMLPAVCGGGCGVTLQPDGDWHTAHVVDGDPERGYVATCVGCNERSKGRGFESLPMGAAVLTCPPLRGVGQVQRTGSDDSERAVMVVI